MITPEQFKTLHRLIQERMDSAVALSWAEFDDQAELLTADEEAKEKLSSCLQTLMQPDDQLSAARREAAESQGREQWYILKAHELHEMLTHEPNTKAALELAEHYLRMMQSAPQHSTALAAAIEQARREEREACLDAADAAFATDHVLNAIRVRSKK
jgi:hypothetical protein